MYWLVFDTKVALERSRHAEGFCPARAGALPDLPWRNFATHETIASRECPATFRPRSDQHPCGGSTPPNTARGRTNGKSHDAHKTPFHRAGNGRIGRPGRDSARCARASPTRARFRGRGTGCAGECEVDIQDASGAAHRYRHRARGLARPGRQGAARPRARRRWGRSCCFLYRFPTVSRPRRFGCFRPHASSRSPC